MAGDDVSVPAALEAAGLYDPRAPDAPERLALLEYLLGVGATIDDLAGTPAGDFGMLASSIALWNGRDRLSLDEAVAAAGVDRELVSRTWRAAGFPDPDPDPNVRVFTRNDVEILATLQAGIEFFGEDVTLQLVRVLGSAAARVADASVSAFVVNVAAPAFENDPSGLAVARANAESIALLDGLTSAFDTLLRHNIERGFRPLDNVTAPGIDLVRRSIGFADLVDSTAWTAQLDLPALSQALGAFDSTASEVVVGNGGRVVKLIGDSVMFVAEEPLHATEAGLALIDAFAAHDLLPPVRVGVATGDVLARDGDYSGAVVNLAARATAAARPSTLLVDRETLAAVEEHHELSHRSAGAFKLKGFDKRVPLVRVKRRVSD